MENHLDNCSRIQEKIFCAMDSDRDQTRIRMLLDLAVKLNTAFVQSADLEEILQAVLVGVTAGEGLGFNRAFLVRVDAEEQNLTGVFAVGPATKEEALQIWNDIDLHNLSIFEILERVTNSVRNAADPLNQLALRIRIPLVETDHVLVRSLRENQAFLVGGARSDGPEAPSDLVDLLGMDQFAVAPLASATQAYGVILADNIITRRSILLEDVEALQLFAGLASFGVCKAHMCSVLESQVLQLRQLNAEVERNKELLVQAERYTALGRMADLVLHEIRNPLSAIGGIARMLQRKNQDPDLYKYAKVIIRESHRLERILEGLFDFTQAPKLALQPVQFYQLIRASLVLLRSEFTRQHIELHTNLPDPDLALYLDRGHIQQALVNILKNAVEAMPEGGILDISARSGDQWVEVRVTDTGPGIAQAHLSRALEPFFTTKIHGMGLGLSLAKRIFELHGGTMCLSCDSSGGGATVSVTLPRISTDFQST